MKKTQKRNRDNLESALQAYRADYLGIKLPPTIEKTGYAEQIEELMEIPINTILKSLYLDPDFRSTVKVEEIVGLGAHAVAKRLKKVGVEVRDYREKDIPIERLKELYEEYRSVYKVGKEVGLSACAVARRLKKMGVELGKWISDERLKELYDEYKSTYKVGEIVGLSANGVAYRLKGAGIGVYNQGEYIKKLEELMGAPINTILKSLYLDPDFRSTVKVGEIVGLGAHAVAKRLKKAGVELRKDIPIERLKELYEEYRSLVKVGKEIGLSRESIARRLKGAGIGVYNQGEYIKKLEELMGAPINTILKSLYLDPDFRSIIKVGEIVGINPGTVARRLKKVGVEINNEVNYPKQLEELMGSPINTILKSLYLDPDFKSSCKVGELIGIPSSSVAYRLKKVGVEFGKAKDNLESALQSYRAYHI